MLKKLLHRASRIIGTPHWRARASINRKRSAAVAKALAKINAHLDMLDSRDLRLAISTEVTKLQHDLAMLNLAASEIDADAEDFDRVDYALILGELLASLRNTEREKSLLQVRRELKTAIGIASSQLAADCSEGRP